jgi:hypothetical protein
MNTSANTNQTHDTTTRTARAKGFLRRGMAGALLATTLTAIGIDLAATAQADFGAPGENGANCQTDPWGFLGSQRRTLCDGPISKDGSWSRTRTIWVPAHYSTPICTSSGGRSYSTNCYGGYLINQHEVSNETYPVRPETVLPDEPGHLG